VARGAVDDNGSALLQELTGSVEQEIEFLLVPWNAVVWDRETPDLSRNLLLVDRRMVCRRFLVDLFIRHQADDMPDVVLPECRDEIVQWLAAAGHGGKVE
jgi:hypothetical protein